MTTTLAQRAAARKYQSKCKRVEVTFSPVNACLYDWLLKTHGDGRKVKGSDVIAALIEGKMLAQKGKQKGRSTEKSALHPQ